jgi:rhamnose utilization protein RhaD (predicted bifunctional aldolase and dehydrogenase)
VTAELVGRSNRLGADPRNTNYAGGNTSAKGTATDPVTGQEVELLWVKGSGGDLGTLKPNGLVILQLDRLRALADLYPGVEREDEMVAAFDYCLHGKGGAAPSIDTAMHGLVDAPQAIGCILGGHGITAWGQSSDECEARSLEIIRTAEAFIATGSRPEPFGPVIAGYQPLPEAQRRARAAALAPVIRGLASTDRPQVVLVPGIGMFSYGANKQTARVAGEFYINAINVMRGAEALSSYAPIDEVAVAAAIDAAVLAFGGVDLVVNNAGPSISKHQPGRRRPRLRHLRGRLGRSARRGLRRGGKRPGRLLRAGFLR